jgi:hypothetical protein
MGKFFAVYSGPDKECQKHTYQRKESQRKNIIIKLLGNIFDHHKVGTGKGLAVLKRAE